MKSERMKKVTIIGAGTMGNGIAHVFAQSGFSVSLVDISQELLTKALSTVPSFSEHGYSRTPGSTIRKRFLRVHSRQ